MKLLARAVLFTLLGWVAGLSLSSAAQAAPFQQYSNATSCPTPLLCNVDFAVVPAGKVLSISNVSCYLRTNGDEQLYAMQLLRLGISGGAILSAVTIQPLRTDFVSPSSVTYAANHTIFAFATAGQRFRAYTELKSGAIQQFACHISGQLLP